MIDKSISWDDYCQIKRMNPSTLVAGLKSMKHLRRAIFDLQFREESSAMRLGTGIHALLLEPDEFEERFCVLPSFNLDKENLRLPKFKGEPEFDRMTDSKNTAYYKARVAEFQAEHAGKTYLDRHQYDTALHCIEAINSRPQFTQLIQSSNKEVTVVGEIDGVEFKGRIDLLQQSCICDLKTTYDVAQFGKTFNSLDYAFKLAIYRELVRQSTSGVRDVKVIAQETKDDFDNAMFTVPSELLDNAMNQVMLVVAQYKQALQSDEWPGWDRGEDEIEIEIPYWAKKQLEQLDWTNVRLSEESALTESECHF